MIYILYHGDCFDGTAAAWIASNAITKVDAFMDTGGLPRTQKLIPCQYGEAPPDLKQFKDCSVYILDFSFPRAYLLELNAIARHLQVIDHHKTAQADCAGLPFCSFDMNRSGAGLTWDFFHGAGSPRPKLVDYIEDRDLWRNALPYSKEVHAWIASYPKKAERYDDLADRLSVNFDNCVAEGSAILRYQTQKVEELAKEYRLVSISGYMVPLVNAPYQFGSDVCHRLLGLNPSWPFAAYFCILQSGDCKYGLRGRDTDDFDVSEIAKRYGGGGHKKAAGFKVKFPGVLP